MRHAFAFGALVFFLTADLPLPAQIPGPGEPGGCLPGYPCGNNTGGPGIPFPGRHKKKKDDQQEPLQTLNETMLRQLDDNSIVVESKDTRLIHMKRLPSTKFLRDGDPMKASVLKPGDHLIIDYREDDEGFMTAVNVTLEKEGTPSERAHASVPVEILEPVSQSKADDERPVQRRRDSKKADSSNSDAQPPAPHADTAQTPAAAPSSAPADAAKAAPPATAPAAASTELPPIVPPDAGLDLDHIPTNTSSHAPVDDSDSGPPKLARGKPKPKKATDADQVALNSPPAPASAASAPASAPPAAPSSEPQLAATGQSPAPAAEGPSFGEMAPPVDAHIQKAREAADAFTETLPDYICQQQTARFQSTTHVVSWVPMDLVSAELVYEKGKESYRNLAINGKPAKAKRMEEIPGSISTGEFGSVLVDLFSPATAADFRFRRNSKSGGRDALLYDFQVDREHSHWAIHAPSQSVLPAYRGSVWIDKETGRTLRIEMQTVHLPEEFPFDKIEMATDYEFIRLSEHQFLLPVHSENLMCQRGTSVCAHNVIDFRNYHKFTGESTIEFGK
ncbi:MAG TPA: hypothetical protein VK335_33230 [Bryobacteraceae bacterium]|nr:hypothetical protein [Bryobacteraceae bacterium]